MTPEQLEKAIGKPDRIQEMVEELLKSPAAFFHLCMLAVTNIREHRRNQPPEIQKKADAENKHNLNAFSAVMRSYADMDVHTAEVKETMVESLAMVEAFAGRVHSAPFGIKRNLILHTGRKIRGN